MWFPYYHHTPCRGSVQWSPTRELKVRCQLQDLRSPTATTLHHQQRPSWPTGATTQDAARSTQLAWYCQPQARKGRSPWWLSGIKKLLDIFKNKNTKPQKILKKLHKHQNRSICPVAKRCSTTWSSAAQGKLAQVGSVRVLVTLKDS